MPGQRRHRLGRRWVVAAVAVLLVCAGGVAWASNRAPAKATTKTAVITASLGSFKQQVSASGTFAPAHEADLSFPVSGVVTAVSVTVGQSVKAGQSVATLDSAALAAQVAQAQATVASDTARVAANTGSSSAQQAADQAALAAAQQQQTSAQASLAQATLVTPVAGTVASVSLTAGQQVTGAGSSGAAGPTGGSGAAAGAGGTRATGTGGAGTAQTSTGAQVVVISTDAWVVNASVDDTEVGLLGKGQQAVITPNGSSTPVYGVVTSIGLLSTSTSGVALFPVLIDVTGSPGGLHDGAGAQLAITVRQLNDVLEVPTAAITFAAGKAQVTLAGGKRQIVRDVSVGQSSTGMTQIQGGLVAGDQVVVSAQASRTGRTGVGSRGGAGRGGGVGGGFGGGNAGGGG